MKTNYSHIVAVIDCSDSMSKITGEVISGFNKFLMDMQAVPGTATFSMYLFNNVVDKVMDFYDLHQVPRLDDRTYVPEEMTALYDGWGAAIDETGERLAAMAEEDRPDKVVVLVITDGQENASSRFSKLDIKERVDRQSGVYKWQFVFLAANQDAILTGAELGVEKDATISFAHDGRGFSDAIGSTGRAISHYRMGLTAGVGYTIGDRALQDRTPMPDPDLTQMVGAALVNPAPIPTDLDLETLNTPEPVVSPPESAQSSPPRRKRSRKSKST